MTDKAIEIQPDTDISVMAEKHERSVIYAALAQWCNERAEQAASIVSLERK